MTITPAFIMGLFPNVRVSRTVQGNAYAVSLHTPKGRDVWSIIEVVPTINGALAVAADLNRYRSEAA
jgi:hypothetical protein